MPAARTVRTALAAVVALATLAALAAASPAAGAVDAAAALRISFLPQKTFRGQAATLAVVARPAGVRCVGSVLYVDGRKQALRATVAKAGKATWRWTVPLDVKLGQATVDVSCKGAGRVSRTISVVGRPTDPARVEVERSGFSQRVKFTTREVSYGVVLGNVSRENDALAVAVHVNFLSATGTVLKTAVANVRTIGAQGRYFLGGYVTIPEGIPVSTLEILPRVGAQQPKSLRVPKVTDTRVVPSPFEPGWVGAVYFQVQNDQPLHVFSMPSVSAVLFDAAGNVIGGGTGFSATPLAPGVRAQYEVTQGLSSIPFDRVASASISVLGTYTRET